MDYEELNLPAIPNDETNSDTCTTEEDKETESLLNEELLQYTEPFIVNHINGKTYAELGSLSHELSSMKHNVNNDIIVKPSDAESPSCRSNNDCDDKPSEILNVSHKPSDIYGMLQPLNSLTSNHFTQSIPLHLEGEEKELESFLSNYNQMRAIIEDTTNGKNNLIDTITEAIGDPSPLVYTHPSSLVDVVGNEQPFSTNESFDIDMSTIRNLENYHMEGGEGEFQDILDMIDPLNDIETNMLITSSSENLIMAEDEEETKLVKKMHDAFHIWKKKYRKLVVEEYPDACENEIEENLQKIWERIPDNYRKKYYNKASLNTKSQSKCNYKSKSKKSTKEMKQKVKQPPKKTRQKRKLKVIKPKAIRPSNNSCEMKDEDENETNDDGFSIDFSTALKETMTYNSTDKNVKKRLCQMKSNDKEKEINDFLQDVMITGNIVGMGDRWIPQDFETMANNVDINELHSYLSGGEIFVENDTSFENEVTNEIIKKQRDTDKKTKRREREREKTRERRKKKKEEEVSNSHPNNAKDENVEESESKDSCLKHDTSVPGICDELNKMDPEQCDKSNVNQNILNDGKNIMEKNLSCHENIASNDISTETNIFEDLKNVAKNKKEFDNENISDDVSTRAKEGTKREIKRRKRRRSTRKK